ncbi:tumor necrosis factor receptor superfamily member 17-like [Chiloscyllium plagiosum]|uniref:tumor necrosis factor receptor superfamily member 17-like n=1 Tax=Chiloscyllium plagiosum TaxID=36176 RepID=UPI001CB8748B|nr:tumor necrosis factor receptor superfamily member 17-like [Chiloscyllium plagiosum]
MAPTCSKSFYYDELMGACEPCQLRCNNLQTRPSVCQDDICLEIPESSTSTWSNVTVRNFWVIIGLLPLLIIVLFVFAFVLRKLHQRKSRTLFKSTEVTYDSSAIVSGSKEHTLAKDEQRFSPVRNQQYELCVESEVTNCTSRGNGMKKLVAGTQENCDCDASLPLPATEEGATILVTTKTVEWCSKKLNPGSKRPKF